MNRNTQLLRFLSICVLGGALTACSVNAVSGQDAANASLVARVTAALENSSDLPANALEVDVDEGRVIVSGSVACDECGGTLTPGGTASVQQSLGAVVRAVPGVEQVEFDLQYQQ
jgi:osmotically-inducible protein OsmY